MGRTAPRLSIVPGTRFNAGLLQITGLSIQHKDFADRALTPIDLCRCTVPLSGTICGNKAQPSCVPTACQTSGPGHCTPGYSDNSIETAYDGLLGRGDGYTTTIQQASRPIETHTIEVDLGSTIRVCGVQLYWDASGQYAQTWRVLATNGAAYDLWAEAAPEGGGKEVISGPPAWAITPNQAGQVAQNDYGLQCVNARRVRLEMEDSASPLFFKLLELRLLTGEAPCTCRHGGVCLDNGGCSCPTVAHRDCFIPECGWGGPTCSQASCGPRDDPAVRCNNCRGSNCCTGPNTCTCTLGWHGTSGPQQCVTPRCGDGAVTNTVEGGSERCDDGNLVNGDGCSDQCQVEELHPQRLASPSPPATSLYVPLEEIPGGSQCTEDCTEMVNDQGVATALMNRCRNDGMQCLRSASDSSVAGRLELCEVDIGPQCLVVAQQVVHHEPVCTKNGQLLVGVGFDGCPALGGRKEVKYEFKQFSCDVICYNGGRCPSHKNGCICPAGWEGDDCSISQCSRGCDHGGTCINTDDCGDCSRGWTGEFCGTAEGFLATLTVCFAAVVCVVLAFSIVLTCLRMTWVPIRARGMMSLLGKFIGGIIWIMTAVCSIWGEMFAYDARLGPHVAVGARGTCMVEVNEPWKTSWAVTKPHWPQTADDDCADQIYCHRDDELSEDCEGNTNKWQFWYTLVFGFGLWLASNLGYLRSMIQIHISHKLPLAFIALAIFLLAPWMIASWVGSPFLALGLAIAYLLYTCMLYAELWPIRTDFLDVKHHAWGCIAAIVNVMGQIWIVQGGRVGRRIDWDLDWDFKAVVPATLATVNALVTVSIVAVHFCFTAGHLLYLALFKANNPHVLEEYYDEYNPDDKDHFKAQMHTFDHQVRTHARTIDDHSLRGRIARRRFKGDTSVMEEEQQTRVENHCGWKSCLLFPFTAGLVYFCPVDKREVYVRDGSPVNPLCHHKIHRSAKASYHHVAQNTVVGHHVHKHAYHREQFGARKKLKVKTLEGMGRNTDESKLLQISWCCSL